MVTKKRDFTEEEVDDVWKKAIKQPDNNPGVFRKDYAGAWIKREDYGDRTKPYGWEIDHLKPLSKGGTYDLENLYPMHWKNNASKGDDYPHWKTAVTSDGNKNTDCVKGWRVDE